MERLFGTLNAGMAFGESGFDKDFSSKFRFYNAIVLQECYILQLKKEDFVKIVDA
jgi:hypothetical protein